MKITTITQILKELCHRRVFAVCLQSDPESYELGLSARSFDLKWNPWREMTSESNADYAPFQAWHYSRNNLYLNRSVRDALRILLFWYNNFLKTIRFLSKWIRGCNFVQVTVLKKTLTFNISLKQNFKSSSVIEYLYNHSSQWFLKYF